MATATSRAADTRAEQQRQHSEPCNGTMRRHESQHLLSALNLERRAIPIVCSNLQLSCLRILTSIRMSWEADGKFNRFRGWNLESFEVYHFMGWWVSASMFGMFLCAATVLRGALTSRQSNLLLPAHRQAVIASQVYFMLFEPSDGRRYSLAAAQLRPCPGDRY